MKKSFSRVLVLAAMLCCVIAASAFADSLKLNANFTHISEVPLIDCKPSYTSATFNKLQIVFFGDGDVSYISRDVEDELNGRLSISGGDFFSLPGDEGDYPLYHGQEGSESQTFNIIPRFEDGFVGLDVKETKESKLTYFAGTKENESMNGYTVSWEFDNPDLVAAGSDKVFNFRSTAEQLASFVPYVELTLSNNTVTATSWRIVDPSDPTKPISSAPGLISVRIDIVAKDGSSIFNTFDSGIDLSSGATVLSGTVTDNHPYSIDNLSYINIELIIDDAYGRYIWTFRPVTPHPYIMVRSRVNADLVDGKSNYSNAEFGNVDFIIGDGSDYFEEERAFATEAEIKAKGTITISGAAGSYTYGSTKDTASDAANPQSFSLYNEFYYDDSPKNTEKTYNVVDENGNDVHLYGGAETGALKGATLTVNFPDMPEMNITDKVHTDFWSFSEQKEYAVPYIEVESSGGKITGIKWRVVKTSDVDTPLTLGQVEGFRRVAIELFNNEGKSIWGRARMRVGREIENSPSAVLEGSIGLLSEDVKLSAVKMVRTFIDDTATGDSSSFCRFIWRFYPAVGTTSPEIEKTAEPTVSEDKAAETIAEILGESSEDIEIQSLTDNNNNVEFQEDSEPSDYDEQAATVKDGRITYKPAVFLPIVTVTVRGVYMFNITDLSLVGKRLKFFAMPMSSQANSVQRIKYSAADDDSDDEFLAFLDNNGAKVDKMPEDGSVNVVLNLKATTYAPILSAETIDNEEAADENNDQADENNVDEDDKKGAGTSGPTSSKHSSSGCNAGFGVIAALAALSLFSIKRTVRK